MQQAGSGSVDRSRALYERPALVIEDEQTFTEVKRALTRCFSDEGIADFLRGLDKAGLRIRDFSKVLAAGKLGISAPVLYASLSPGDQGQLRELYLASLEQVALPLRDRYFRLYAYY